MKMPRITLALGLVIAAVLQTAVLAWMVIDRTRLLKTGQEVVLPILPVDPRDLFRGQYVRLGYDISNVPIALLEGPRPTPTGVLYVTIAQQSDGTWKPVRLSGSKPQTVGDKQVVLKGRPAFRFPRENATAVFVRYGIERFFVPEGEGPRLEDMARDKKLSVLLAVDGSGTAAIKGIIIDGKLQYSERLL
jgi:uncharacterized membrane-anchored protein